MTAPNSNLRATLANLDPQGSALKRHILDRLAGSPETLTASQIAASGGPARNLASTWCALQKLEQLGVVEMIPRLSRSHFDRWQIAEAAREHVAAFLRQTDTVIERFSFRPIVRGCDKFKSELAIVGDGSYKWFTIQGIADQSQNQRVKSIRKRVMYLFSSGYVVRRLTDPAKPGRPVYEFRLNSEAAAHVRELLQG